MTGHSDTLRKGALNGVVSVVDSGFPRLESTDERTLPMSTSEQLINARLGVLALAQPSCAAWGYGMASTTLPCVLD